MEIGSGDGSKLESSKFDVASIGFFGDVRNVSKVAEKIVDVFYLQIFLHLETENRGRTVLDLLYLQVWVYSLNTGLRRVVSAVGRLYLLGMR